MIDIEIPVPGLKIHEVIDGSPIHVAALLDLHRESFPQYAQYLPYMQRRVRLPAVVDPRFVEHWWLVEVGEQSAGFILFKYIPTRNCGLGLLITVKPDYRMIGLENGYLGLAHLLIQLSLKQLKLDASAANRGEPLGLVVEVEVPKLVERYRKYGYQSLKVNYYSPPYIQGDDTFVNQPVVGKKDFIPSQLGVYPYQLDVFNDCDQFITVQAVKAFLVDHYGLPEDHEAVVQVLDSIPQNIKG